MDQLTIIGLVAGLITTLGFVPQVIKGYRSGRMEDVSLIMPLVLMVGMGLWLVYGIFLDDLPIIFWNAVSIALNAVMVFLKLRSDQQRKTGADPQFTR
ncbi:MAG: SemiSWEET family sugar transporter [Methanomassiliicoccales archaeon]